jgi:transcription initiation factor TFIID subunit 7
MSGFKLKLNVNTCVNKASSISTPTSTTLTPGGSKPAPKFKIKTSSNPSTPVPVHDEAPKPKKTKAGRAAKPSAKLIESRKRIKEESESEGDNSTINVQPPSKKIKLQIKPGQTPKTPITPGTGVIIKAKVKGKPPKRPLGEGYDSEAEDREEDPTIEEEFILRMMPGDDCDYLRQAITDKRIGIPVASGGADVRMRFYDGDGRRAAVTIRRKPYAATLVDLPCIVEGMKSWDKRGWWKSADICQMLWVFAPITKEEEAKTIPLPSIIDPQTYQYPHGLTPPMHYARKRRFRKRISRTAIEAVEDAVEKLLAADAQADDVGWEMIDPDRQGSGSPPGDDLGEEYSEDEEDEDAEGEEDDGGYFGNGHTHEAVDDSLDMDADLEADLEAAMQADEFEAASTPISTMGATPLLATGETPAAEVEEEEEDSGDESTEDGEDDENNETGGAVQIDEDEKARQAAIEGTREDIAELEKQLQNALGQLAQQQNPILRRRIDDNIRKMKNELQLKKSSIGEGDDD